MAFANQGRSISRVGLRRTLRFQWRSSDREVMPRDLFCTRIIKGQLNLTVEDVSCIQWHQQATGYDVSFVSAETHQAVTARCARLANKHPLNLCEVVNMDRPNFRIISVHMFNPFMTDLALMKFFGRFSYVVSAARYVRDPQGFWTGCPQFQVLLHPDAEEAIRADASVRVTLVPGGGDLRVKLSQYADDTTLLLDSDECVVRALELFENFGRVSGARLNIGKCTVKGVRRGVMLLRVDYRRTCSPLCSTWHLVRNGVEWSTEGVAKGVEWEVTERMKWDVDKLGYHAAKEKWKGPVNFSGGTAQDFEVPVEEQRQGSDAKGFVLHQNHQGPVESDGGGRFLYSVASAGNRVSGPVVDSSRFCCTQMFPVLLHPDAEEAIRADASVRVTLVPGGGDLRVKHSQYADDTTLLLDSDECVVRALELFEDFGRVSGARLNIGKCTVKGVGRGVMLLRVDYRATVNWEGRFQRVKSRLALWKARKLTLLGKVLVLKADMLSSVLHLAYVFLLPVAIRRPLARTIFDFL
ncbi:hypothetical protein Q8A73_006303 [Channa argus]|nr:hypothetical protein Q8A73_006303 [Channa argus]